MKKTPGTIFFLMFFVAFGLHAASAKTVSRKVTEREVQSIIDRFTHGKLRVKLSLSLDKAEGGRDRFAYQVKGRTLNLQASSGVAACRGLYDYVKTKGAGICSWSGNRFELPSDLSIDPKQLTSQYRDHQYMNVVTYGYTCAYWDEERWDQEIDWMALHGIDMPLVLIGAEQVYREVFYDMGLTKEEVDAWEVGPAHLPWFRMGNLAGNSFNGPLGEEWNQRQEALCKHVLKRMRALGMKPICPAFGGFVPKEFTQHYPGTTEATGWDWIPKDCPNYRLNPSSSAFVEVGRRFIQKWEEKYGVCQYYLSDSFNEMAIPDDTALLTQYGDSIYKSIRTGSAHPDAVWVTQGWTFVFQQRSWGAEKFEALTRHLPDHNFMVLYMSPEYGQYGKAIWEDYHSFNHKDWCYTLLPNMGGKNVLMGRLDDYAVNFLKTLNESTDKGSLTGYGLTPEGVENNELLYELVTDAGWLESGTVDLTTWLAQYAQCRYGLYTPEMQAYHAALRQSVYGYFTDHPRYGWQVGPNLTGQGSARQSDVFYSAVEQLFANLPALRSCNLLARHDLVEAVAFYVGGKLEKLNARIQQAIEGGQSDQADRLIATLDRLMLDMDRALTCHPLYSLQRWEQLAQQMATQPATRRRNAENARRLVTVWYGDHKTDEPVQDYAARVWSGLVRDYYRPRLVKTWQAKQGKQPFNRCEWEEKWVQSSPYLSDYEPVPSDTLTFLRDLVQSAKAATTSH